MKPLFCFFCLLFFFNPPSQGKSEEQVLSSVITQIYGQPVLDHDHEQEAHLQAAATLALQKINRNGINANRVNEVGNAVEPYVLEALNEVGFTAHIPQTQSGHFRAFGYPDISAQWDNDYFYIEVKTYHPKNEETTQRSFYLSPNDNPKVTRPAYHLLIAFAMLPDETDTYFAQKVSLLDIANLPLHLKTEFNASNQDLYSRKSDLIFTQSAP